MTKLQSTTWSVPDARNKDRSKTPKKVSTNSTCDHIFQFNNSVKTEPAQGQCI